MILGAIAGSVLLVGAGFALGWVVRGAFEAVLRRSSRMPWRE